MFLSFLQCVVYIIVTSNMVFAQKTIITILTLFYNIYLVQIDEIRPLIVKLPINVL